MLDSKRTRLEARGWKFGTAAEFLSLSPVESAYIEVRMKLAADLRARRLRRKLTQGQLAALIGSSQSRVAKMESGNPSVSLDLLVRALLALGASVRTTAEALTSGKADK
jgi:DNA-binding XRE family transcriptional regulator